MRALRVGPVCLQETRWGEEQPRRVRQSLAGVQVVATPGLVTDGGCSGGAAILVPVGYDILDSRTVVAGRVIAAHLQLRSQTVWMVSAYVHPSERKEIVQSLTAFLDDLSHDGLLVISVDFNGADVRISVEWSELLDNHSCSAPQRANWTASSCVLLATRMVGSGPRSVLNGLPRS